jgi:hypothetical protein
MYLLLPVVQQRELKEQRRLWNEKEDAIVVESFVV